MRKHLSGFAGSGWVWAFGKEIVSSAVKAGLRKTLWTKGTASAEKLQTAWVK
jgi:hypothetical protein